MSDNPQHRPSRRPKEGYHDPTRGMGGAPPARSALALRAALAVFGLVFCAGSAALLAATAAPYAWIAALAALALVACVDLAFIAYRLRGKVPG